MVYPICGGRLEKKNTFDMTCHIVCDTRSYMQTADGYILTEYMEPDDVAEQRDSAQ